MSDSFVHECVCFGVSELECKPWQAVEGRQRGVAQGPGAVPGADLEHVRGGQRGARRLLDPVRGRLQVEEKKKTKKKPSLIGSEARNVWS